MAGDDIAKLTEGIQPPPTGKMLIYKDGALKEVIPAATIRKLRIVQPEQKWLTEPAPPSDFDLLVEKTKKAEAKPRALASPGKRAKSAVKKPKRKWDKE